MKAKDLETLLNQWGLIVTRIDRGYIVDNSDYYFKVKDFDEKKDQIYIDEVEISSSGKRFGLFQIHLDRLYSIETNMSHFKIGMMQARIDQMYINGKDEFLTYGK